MHRPHPFRLYRRTVGKSCKWYAVYDDDPAHPRSTGVDASKRGSYDRAIAAAYARRPGGGRGAMLRTLTEDMYTEDCRYRRRMMAKRSPIWLELLAVPPRLAQELHLAAVRQYAGGSDHGPDDR